MTERFGGNGFWLLSLLFLRVAQVIPSPGRQFHSLPAVSAELLSVYTNTSVKKTQSGPGGKERRETDSVERTQRTERMCESDGDEDDMPRYLV